MNRKILLLTAAACLYGTVAAHAWENDLTLVDKIDVQSDKGLATFDISYVDAKIDLYVLADRTNASVDFVNTKNNVDIKSMTIKDAIPITDPTNSGATFRVEEMTWDERDHIVAAANNAQRSTVHLVRERGHPQSRGTNRL